MKLVASLALVGLAFLACLLDPRPGGRALEPESALAPAAPTPTPALVPAAAAAAAQEASVGREAVEALPAPVREVEAGALVELPDWGLVGIAHLDGDYADTPEAFALMGASVVGTLDTTREELEALEPEFWNARPEWAWLLEDAAWGDPPRARLVELERFRTLTPELDLAELYAQDPETRALWSVLQRHRWARANVANLLDSGGASPALVEALEEDLELVEARLEEVRRALWGTSALDEAYSFLHDLARGLRQ
jgi:hypothetical protein